ncbi:alanyl-tRNA editing protein [Bacillus sp. DNRA2]|uniref:alanyl-tRNA editing protein n=1 Tax=Bacillus sp. DNRA2 TaxID=2723053 RepID=UPI00145D4907|nr:DHHA1 domain-containing protein [Bacillus sp. DNRA2]NMD68966.1 alanyl-tRNA editing protein [Bacillus sp. DNRA2]
MEHKLYYEDPYRKSFSAKILRQAQDDDGQWYVILNQTAFYPTGGGQPHDTGTLNEIKVTNVEEINGEIRHYIESPLVNENSELHGNIDWPRRFDHMQQHAGQHILSAAFEELFVFPTISFHLGAEVLTIDLETDQLTEEQAQQAEQRANEIILENRPIQPTWVSPEQAAKYPLRKQLSVTEDIRLVIIPDYDYNGCGGTHPSSTGQVGSLKILDWERQKKKIRVQFVCGNRVLSQLYQKQKVLKSLGPLLNAPEADMVKATQKLLDGAKEKDKALEEAREALLQYEALELIQGALPERKVSYKIFQNRTIQELQKLGRAISAQAPDNMAILISESPEKMQLVCARGENVQISMKKLISELLPQINGKGGGNDHLAQGGGEPTMSGQQLLDKALTLIV